MTWIEEAQEVQYHVNLSKGDVGRYVFLPGDPGRCEKIASYFDNPRLVTHKREYRTYTGTLLGEKVSVTSTGIGCPSTAIAVEELIAVGADTFIRIGTSGGMQPHIKTGDIAIVTAAIRDEGTTSHYMPIEFPALANIDVVVAMRQGAINAGIPYHLGVSQSKDSFYGEIDPDSQPIAGELHARWDAWVKGGAISSEMEAAAIFIVSAIHRKRAGGVMMLYNEPHEAPVTPEEIKRREEADKLADIDRAIRAAVEGLKVLIQQDKNEQ